MSTLTHNEPIVWGCFWRVVVSRIRPANTIFKFIHENTNLPMCTSLRRRGPEGGRGGVARRRSPEAERGAGTLRGQWSQTSSIAPAGKRLSCLDLVRALLNGLKVLSRAGSLSRSPGYVATLRRKRFRCLCTASRSLNLLSRTSSSPLCGERDSSGGDVAGNSLQL